MKNMKIWALLSLLTMSCMHAATVAYKIEDDLFIDFYNAKDDEAAIRAIVLDTYEIEDSLKNQYKSKIESLEFEAHKKSMLDWYDQQLKDDPTFNDGSLVLIYKGKTIGFCVSEVDKQAAHAHICMFVIDKNYRHCGHGEKFLNKSIEVLQVLAGAKSISLCAHPVTNSAAIKLYKKLGFEQVGEQDNLQSFSKKLID